MDVVLLDQRIHLLRNNWPGQDFIPHLLPPNFPAEAISNYSMDMHCDQSDGDIRVLYRGNIRLLSHQLCMDTMGRRAPRTLREQQQPCFRACWYRNCDGFRHIGTANHSNLESAHVKQEEDWSATHVQRRRLRHRCFDAPPALTSPFCKDSKHDLYVPTFQIVDRETNHQL